MRRWRAAAGTAVVAATPAVVADLMAAADTTAGAGAEAITAAVRSMEAVPMEVLAEDHLAVRAAARSAAQEVAHRLTRG
jgi:hypothetical protein